MKKLLALLMALVLVLSFAACGKKEAANEVTTEAIVVNEEDKVNEDDFTTAAPVETTTSVEVVTDESGEEVTDASGEKVTEIVTEKTTTLADKPVKEWTKAEILMAYNAAVKKTDPNAPTGQSTMKLKGGITGDGAIGKIASVVSPIAEAALARNSTPTNFIPGYGELRGEDLKSIKVTDNGKTYIVEMTVKSQTDGSDADDKAGPVGRAIGTLGSIDGALKELGATFKSGRETVKLTYDDVSVRAEIDKASGLIVHGQWHYVVNIFIGNAEASISILNAELKNIKAAVDYTVAI